MNKVIIGFTFALACLASAAEVPQPAPAATPRPNSLQLSCTGISNLSVPQSQATAAQAIYTLQLQWPDQNFYELQLNFESTDAGNPNGYRVTLVAMVSATDNFYGIVVSLPSGKEYFEYADIDQVLELTISSLNKTVECRLLP